MTSVEKNKLISSVWENFYDTLRNDVVGTSVTDTHSITHTLSRATNSFPDTAIDKKSTYPILIVHSPNFSADTQFTLNKEESSGTIEIEIYTTSSEAADKFIDSIIDSIETNRGDLADAGLHKVVKASVDSDSIQREQIKLHVRTVTYSFVFRYTRTGSY